MNKSLILLPFLALGLAACEPKVQAPGDRGVCYFMVRTDGEIRFNKVAEKVENLEGCAKELEMMRRRFLGMGGSVQEVSGAYQGQFLFLRREGIFTSQSFDGTQYPMLVRYNDTLVVPGAIQE